MMDTNRLLLLLIFGCAWALPCRLAAAPQPGAVAATHDGVACTVCHGRGDRSRTAAETALVRQDRCLDCHATAASAAPSSMFHGQGHCLRCHTFHGPGAVVTAAGTIDLAALAGVDRGHCRACHDGKGPLADLSESHRIAGRLYHEHAEQLAGLPGSTPCLWCHSEANATEWQAAAPGDRIAFAEHASHPFGIPVEPGRGAVVRRMRDVIDPRIPLPQGRLECVSCHQLTASTKDRLIPFPSPKQLCLGCHRLDAQAGGSGVQVADLAAP